MLAFIRKFAGVKTDQAVQGAMEALVRWDPQGATEAELRVMEEHLDKLGIQVAKANQAFAKEQGEADAILKLSRQRMAAAEMLEKQIGTETDPTKKAALEGSLGTLLGMLEQMAPEVDREQQDAVDAKDFLDELKAHYDEAGNKLKNARQSLERAQRDMTRAEQQRNVAEQRAQGARQAAGLAGATSSLDVALKAMQDAAQRDLSQAEAANMKTRLLKPTKPEEEDANIKAALAAAAGQAPAPTSLADRMAALRARKG